MKIDGSHIRPIVFNRKGRLSRMKEILIVVALFAVIFGSWFVGYKSFIFILPAILPMVFIGGVWIGYRLCKRLCE